MKSARLLAATALTGAMLSVGAAPSYAVQTGWIRGGHLAVGVGTADLYLTPYAGGDPVVVRDVSYREITDYANVPAGRYTVAVRAAGAAADTAPMISAEAVVEPGQATSVFAIGDKDNARGRVFSDDLSAPPSGSAKVRVVAAAPETDAVSVKLSDGRQIASDVAPGDASDYATVAADAYTATLDPSQGESADAAMPLRGGTVYTVVVLPDEQKPGALTTEVVRDAAGSAQVPTGGVDTGGGGLAPAQGSSLPFALGIGGVVAVVAYAGTARRPRLLRTR